MFVCIDGDYVRWTWSGDAVGGSCLVPTSYCRWLLGGRRSQVLAQVTSYEEEGCKLGVLRYLLG